MRTKRIGTTIALLALTAMTAMPGTAAAATKKSSSNNVIAGYGHVHQQGRVEYLTYPTCKVRGTANIYCKTCFQKVWKKVSWGSLKNHKWKTTKNKYGTKFTKCTVCGTYKG